MVILATRVYFWCGLQLQCYAHALVSIGSFFVQIISTLCPKINAHIFIFSITRSNVNRFWWFLAHSIPKELDASRLQVCAPHLRKCYAIYLAENKVFNNFKSTLFSSKKVVALKRTGYVVWQNKWKQCYRECSKVTTLCMDTRSQSFSFRLYWQNFDDSPNNSTRVWIILLKMTFDIPHYSSYSMWVRWANLHLLMSSSFRIQCAKND